MCGVVGYAGQPRPDLIKKLLLESNIRGQHATGATWTGPDGQLHTFRHPGPATEFLQFSPDGPEGPYASSLFIGHSRYSTSDLRFNQPIHYGHLSVAHNGVITQEPPETWQKTWGYHCETRNDAELILRCLEEWDPAHPPGENNPQHPLVRFPDASMAVCVLDTWGRLRFFRNGKRPLWYIHAPDGSVAVASAREIFTRTGAEEELGASARPCQPFEEYCVQRNQLTATLIAPHDFREDFQRASA